MLVIPFWILMPPFLVSKPSVATPGPRLLPVSDPSGFNLENLN